MRFGEKTIIEDLSFEVEKGEVFGLLGSNGSGKTTTIRALLDIYQPTAGELLIDGKRFLPEMSGSLGYLPEERGLYKKETVLDTMVYFGQLKGLRRKEAKEWAEKYLERVELIDSAGQVLGKLSGGQQQKVQLGVTIMNDPKLLILDEPTKGFDPVNRRLMMDIIQELVAKGSTVILVTHQMEEVEKLCTRLLLLKDGKRRLYGSVPEIKRQYGKNSIIVEYAGSLKPNDILFTIINNTSQSAELAPKDGVAVDEIFSYLGAQDGLKVSGFHVEQAKLDDIFVQIYRKEGKEDVYA
ncbi:TPA: ABC transporter ATP-binding protein [Candidatus Falkowbacteria bacterium]|nr:ABC transporter ATP-binding protein [Candidatus Falkowbacteria bacterium]HAY12739.1 ABC transporter ATP-binding protein [Candidatus Falkowbacteria bacterium]HBI97506.1 ABC transporter ATP-binding protein [Candidatus Falkowbacteria bacterium]HBT27261.1 ABC transporter ATP-binding protein [Candidatus Falkowbacteria bacterium]HBY15414.1 ABC transporter ATP-binding protein [Candidatus Falkowbacteria bacterium]